MGRAGGRFPADPGLRGLTAALDAQEMCGRLRDCFASRSEWEFDVQTCRVDRVRYRRGARCIVQYRLLGRHPGTGLPAQRWVAAEVYPPERLPRVRGKLLSARSGALLADLGMLIQPFPFDRHLPALERLASGTAPALERALLGGFGPGDWRPEFREIANVRYRAGLSATQRYAVLAREARTGRARWRRFYVKAYRGGAELAAHAALEGLWRRQPAVPEGLQAVRPVACLPALGAVVQDEGRGVSLDELVRQGRDPAGPAARAGRALARFHLADAGWAGAELPRRTSRDERAALRRAAQLLAWVDPDCERRLQRLEATIAASLGDAGLVPTHGDLKADHLLLDEERVTMLDVDTFALGDPAADLASLVADLARLRLRVPTKADRLRAAAASLVEAYAQPASPPWRQRLAARCAAGLIHKAVHFFSGQETGWRDHIRTLVDDAEGALAGRAWW